MAWLQLTLESNREDAERLSDVLQRYGAVSVSLSALSSDEVFGFLPGEEPCYWECTRVVALLHEDTDLDTLLICLRDSLGSGKITRHRIERFEDRNWVSEYQQNNGPRFFGERLCISPSWCEPPQYGGATLVLDPGLAFGTGSHETTTLCLEWLTRASLDGKRVIDYGCGSGILALAAILLGAGHAFAVDIDPQALAATRGNAVLNNIRDQLTVSDPDAITLPPADILIANILLNPLQDLASRFAGLVKSGGYVVLSGMLAHQVDECLAVYAAWFNMQAPVFSREWALLQGIRK